MHVNKMSFLFLLHIDCSSKGWPESTRELTDESAAASQNCPSTSIGFCTRRLCRAEVQLGQLCAPHQLGAKHSRCLLYICQLPIRVLHQSKRTNKFWPLFATRLAPRVTPLIWKVGRIDIDAYIFYIEQERGKLVANLGYQGQLPVYLLAR